MLRRAKNLIKTVAYPLVDVFARVATPRNNYITGKLMPLGGHKADYIVYQVDSNTGTSNGLPVPPLELWEGYGTSLEQYLVSGREDISKMLEILKTAGESPQTLRRVLDFGCAAGRMLRFYPYIPSESELWGVDISAWHIVWCQQHLTPPFLFATTTTAPHLPFEDNYFDLVYSGSVFTHISDLADAWFLEVRRVLRKGGYAFITIHDKHTVDLIFDKDKQAFPNGLTTPSNFIDILRRFDQKTSFRSQNYACFSIAADPASLVFHDVKYLVKKWSPLGKIVSITEEAYGYQTALLFQK